MGACYSLWKATGERSYLEEARRLLEGIVEHAPEDYRRSIRETVPLHRNILAAYDEPEPES